MRFDDLDKRMRIYETSADICVLPGMYMVARLDGRSFTKLTKETCQFETPFDIRFRDLMTATAKSLMECGFRVIYAYTESDEISILFDLDEQTYGRKLRKYNSTLAGEASAQFSIMLGQPASFDCRISQLPSEVLVVDYFRWRNEDSVRNALNAWCYWTLRENGKDKEQATKQLIGISVSQKNELLFQYGINFNNLPNWQKRGVGLYWEEYDKSSINPMTSQTVITSRRRIRLDYDLPIKDAYGQFVQSIIQSQHRKETCHGNFTR
ncbi:MAG TPA: guanylyltransferase [Planctomycetaceae bacterium]|nr:guanylyltransferase [Planctomycetaceae bacterium]